MTTIRWVGPWYGVLTGTHLFSFLPDEANLNGTTMTQTETFTGLLSPFMNDPGSMGGKKTLAAFEEVNGDLKRYAEEHYQKKAPDA